MHAPASEPGELQVSNTRDLCHAFPCLWLPATSGSCSQYLFNCPVTHSDRHPTVVPCCCTCTPLTCCSSSLPLLSQAVSRSPPLRWGGTTACYRTTTSLQLTNSRLNLVILTVFIPQNCMAQPSWARAPLSPKPCPFPSCPQFKLC